VRDADDGGEQRLGVAHGDVLDLDGADPLAADLITSLARSVICMNPAWSSVATSPVSKKPPRRGCSARALEVAGRDRVALDLQRPNVVRRAAASARVVHQLQLDPGGARPCLSR
jgi:hypothetical protein